MDQKYIKFVSSVKFLAKIQLFDHKSNGMSWKNEKIVSNQ